MLTKGQVSTLLEELLVLPHLFCDSAVPFSTQYGLPFAHSFIITFSQYKHLCMYGFSASEIPA